MAEKLDGTGGTAQWTNYIVANRELIGMRVDISTGSIFNRYYNRDHLGSIAVIADISDTVVERLSFDSWGKRRFANGNDDPTIIGAW